MALLAIDAGTGSVRAVIFDETGTQLAAAGREWEHRNDPRFPGSMDFEVDRNFGLVSESIREALELAGLRGSDIAGVSATSMREGFVAFDAAGKELWACANVDARASAEVTELRELGAQIEAESYAISGQTFALSAQPRLRWLAKHLPEIYERIDAIEMLSDWVLTRLTGVTVSEPTNACTSGMFSLEDRAWSAEIARMCGLRDDIFPRVVEPGSIVGEVTARAAETTGLAVGTPVVAGGGDAQLAALALGVVDPGQTAISGGTFWQQMVNISELRTDPQMRIRVDCHAIPGVWQAEGIVFTPGLAARWFRDAFGGPEKERAAREGRDPYDLLTERAGHVPPGSHGVIPIFSDVMNYGAWMHAAPSFLNLSLDVARSGTDVLFRALMENAAIVTRGNLGVIASFTGTSSDEVVFASGAAKSPVWTQIVADVLQVPVRVPVVKEATALGAALCAGAAVGSFDDLASAGRSVAAWERVVEPDVANAGVYDEAYGRWQAAYPAQLELARSGVTEPMWRAPGI
ncbi:autoinducer-2 kinase [Ruania rhizosphaerae]|uniref:autoinducer-2 kinase n=1 Tax=Ruania rhizosphaerae TaxID=1840413 RepID=UPI001356875F|nr:autoinducer-2 kinase [Ruania rhizosphaerae]